VSLYFANASVDCRVGSGVRNPRHFGVDHGIAWESTTFPTRVAPIPAKIRTILADPRAGPAIRMPPLMDDGLARRTHARSSRVREAVCGSRIRTSLSQDTFANRLTLREPQKERPEP